MAPRHAPLARSASSRPMPRAMTAGSASARPEQLARTPGRDRPPAGTSSAPRTPSSMSRGTNSGTDVVAPMAAAISSAPGRSASRGRPPRAGTPRAARSWQCDLEVDGQHDPTGSDPAQLGQARCRVVPVVHGQDRQRDVGARRSDRRQGRRAGTHGGRGAGGALGHHDLEGSTATTAQCARLVGAGAGADVDDQSAGADAEMLREHRRPARVRPPVGDVAQPDGVVDGRGHRSRAQPERPKPSGRRLLQDVHAAGRAQPDDVGQADLGALDLAVAGLAAQVGGHLPHVGDAGGGDRVALGLQARPTR